MAERTPILCVYDKVIHIYLCGQQQKIPIMSQKLINKKTTLLISYLETEFGKPNFI